MENLWPEVPLLQIQSRQTFYIQLIYPSYGY